MPATKNIGIPVYENFEPIDLWGFVQAFAIARLLGLGYGDNGPYPFPATLHRQDLGTGAQLQRPARAASLLTPT